MMNQPLRILVFSLATFVSFCFISDERPSLDSANPSCSQLSANEFMVHSDNKEGCLLWGYINMKGKLNIDIETFETDTKVYYWWTTGQFLLKTEIKRFDNENVITIPNARKARLHVKTECGLAKVIIRDTEIRN